MPSDAVKNSDRARSSSGQSIGLRNRCSSDEPRRRYIGTLTDLGVPAEAARAAEETLQALVLRLGCMPPREAVRALARELAALARDEVRA